MSCLPSMNRIPAGYALNDPLPHSSPKRTDRKVARLVRMGQSPKEKVRAAAAGNPMTPEFMLIELSQDKSLLVRSWVARNPACPGSILRSLSKGDDDLASYARWKLNQVVD